MAKTKEQIAADKEAADLAEKNQPAIAKADEKIQHDKALEDAAFNNQADSPTPKTDTVAQIDAATDEALHIAADKEGKSGLTNYAGNMLELGEMAASQSWTKDDHGRNSNPNDVKVQVSYPKNWKGTQSMEEGSIHVVSKEVAAQFEELGIAKIVL